MNDAGTHNENDAVSRDRQDKSAGDRSTENVPKRHPQVRRRWGGRLFALCGFLLLAGGVSLGASRHYSQQRQVAATAKQQRDLVPNVRVARARAADAEEIISLPGTTLAFTAANIFARANGYIQTRKVDIGDHVKAGDLLAQIWAPELDHQIAQAQATLVQNQATLQQVQASRDLAKVTDDRDRTLVQKGWLTPQQGDTDRLTLESQRSGVAVAEANIAAQQALIRVLTQQKDYQSVVAPFDGIITQRNVDIGTLVSAGSTFMFTLMQSDVMRVWVYVPQDAAFGVASGTDAIIRVPELPDRTFPGKVTRLAKALAPGTRTLLTEIDVPNPDGALSPGLYVAVELHIPRKTKSIIVPAEAMVFSRQGLQVVVVENGRAQYRKVTVARDLGTQVELRDGIQAGDEVILTPRVNLADGSKVQATAVEAVQAVQK